jgi:hypothetical protein
MFYISASGFVANLITHFLTLFGVNLPVLGLYFFIPFIFSILAFSLPYAIMVIQLRKYKRKDFWRLYFAPMPSWTKIAVNGLFVYLFINMIISFIQLGDGRVLKTDDQCTRVTASGTQTLTDEECERHSTNEIKLISGHMLIFNFAPLLYFYYHPSNSESPKVKHPRIKNQHLTKGIER